MKTALALAFALALVAPSLARADVVINDSSTTQTIDCAQDPEIAINGSSTTLTFTGPCTKIAVNGSSNTLVIASIEKLAISGSDNTVTADAADKIAVMGSGNKVTYKRAATVKRTKVAKVGTNNSVKKVK